jgi:UDP-GlcNAc:undecaprenyl-phosphate GlcNAc-1-phosphate transferase
VPSAAFGIAVALFAAIGFADDLYGVSVGQRLALQCSASIVAACLLVSPVQSAPGRLAIFVAVGAFWIAGVVNAFNFMDGVNGISAAHALIGGVAYACLGAWRTDPFLIAAGQPTGRTDRQRTRWRRKVRPRYRTPPKAHCASMRRPR